MGTIVVAKWIWGHFYSYRADIQAKEREHGVRKTSCCPVRKGTTRASCRCPCPCVISHNTQLEPVGRFLISHSGEVNFFKLYAFILLTSTLVPGINYFVVTTHPLHQLQVRKGRLIYKF